MGDIVDGMFQDGLLDWHDAEDQEAEYGGRQPSRPRCRRCGSTDVRWRQQSGRWVLFSLQPGVVHTCGTAVADEFDTVSPTPAKD